MTPELRKAALTAALLAYGQRLQLRQKDLEQVLVTLVATLPEPEDAQANNALFHLRECNKALLTLDKYLEDGKTPPLDGNKA